MGDRAFHDLLESIEALIGTLIRTVTFLEKSVSTYAERARNGNQQAAVDQAKLQRNLDETKATIVELRKFWATSKKDWSAATNRVSRLVAAYHRPQSPLWLHMRRLCHQVRQGQVHTELEGQCGRSRCVLTGQLKVPNLTVHSRHRY